MADRVILGSLPGGGYGIRVSRPGYDASNNSIPSKGVSFDSRATSGAKILINGVTTSNGNINFGKTLSYIPDAYFMGRMTTGRWRNVNPDDEHFWDGAAGPGQYWVDMFTSWQNNSYVDIYNNRINIFGVGSYFTHLAYVVLER